MTDGNCVTAADGNYATACGLYCGDCHLLGGPCPGCGYVEGRPFWTEAYGVAVCPLYDCCRNQRQLDHCGLCTDLPCELFLGLRDPDMTDEEHQESLRKRKDALTRRAEVGTEQWLLEVSRS